MYTINSQQLYENIPREDSIILLLKSFLDLNFEGNHATTNKRYADSNYKNLVYTGSMALFRNYEFKTGSGKHLKDFSHGQIVSLMYKLLTSAIGAIGLSSGFAGDCCGRHPELIIFKNQKGKYHVRIMLEDVFGFAEHQEKTRCGLR